MFLFSLQTNKRRRSNKKIFIDNASINYICLNDKMMVAKSTNLLFIKEIIILDVRWDLFYLPQGQAIIRISRFISRVKNRNCKSIPHLWLHILITHFKPNSDRLTKSHLFCWCQFIMFNNVQFHYLWIVLLLTFYKITYFTQLVFSSKC